MSAPSTPMPAGEVRQMAALVAAALSHLAEGRAVDLKTLETRTTKLCRALVALPPDEGRAFLPVLGELMAGLDRLGDAFAQRLEGAILAQGGGA
jgi:hypothetical protein